jgi:cytoskeletal protein CcmA (bactofilin family)
MLSIQGDVVIGGRLSIGGAQMIIQNQLSVNQLFAYEMVAETFTQISDEPNLQLNGLLRVEDSVYVRNSISCSEIFIDNDLTLSSTLSLVAGQVIAADITTLNKLVIGDYTSPTAVLEQTHLSVHGSIDLYNLHANHIYADGGTIANAITMESDLTVAGVLHALQIEQTDALDGPSPIADGSVLFSNALASLVGKTGVFEENLYAKSNLSVAGWCSVEGTVSSTLMDTENAQIQSDLSVGANAYLNNLEVRTDLLLKHQLSLGSNLFMDDNLFVDGEVSVAGKIYPALIHQHIVPKGDGSSVPDLNAFSDNQLSSLLTGGLRVDQLAKVDELAVNRKATFGSVLSVSSEVYLSSNIHVTGTLSVEESVFLKNELIVNNDVCFESALSVIGGTRIQGETDQIGDVRILGQLSVEQNLDVKGVVRIDGGISVSSDALFANTVRLAGGLSVDSSVDFMADVFAHGRLSVGGDTYAEDIFAKDVRTSNLNVERELWIAGGLSVEDHAFFSADLRAGLLIGASLSVQSGVIEDTLSVGGETELFTSRIMGDLFAMSNLYASESLYVENELVGSTLSVTSAVVASNMTVGSNLFVDQSCFVSGVLSVSQLFLGDSDLTPELPQNAVFSNLRVGSNAHVEGYLSVPILFVDTIETPTPSDARYSNLIVNEEGVFLSNLRVDGTLLTNHIEGQGMLLSNGQLSVSALFVNDADLNSEIPSDPRFSNLFVNENALIQGDLSVSRLFADGFDVGVAFFEGAVSLESLIVQSNLSVGGDVSIEGFLSTGSNLQIGGVSLQEHHGQVEISATSISVTTAVYMGGVSIATEGGDTIALNGDTTVRGALDVQGTITQYGLTMSNYQIALEGFSNAIEHRLSRGFQQVFGKLVTDEDFEDIAVGIDIGVRSNWWNNGSYMTLRDTVRDMSVLPINAVTGEIDLGILASVDQAIPTSFDFDANINVTMQDHYGDDRGQMYGVMLHGNHPETANDYIRMNMLNPNNIAFKNKFKADFDLSTLDPEWRVFPDTVTLPSDSLHTQGTVLFNVLFCAYYAPNLAMNSGSMHLEMNDYLVPNTPTRRVNNYYEIMPDRSGYVFKEGTELYPRWTYRKWRNDLLGDIYYTKYKSAFGWGDIPNADEVYSHMASNGSLRELFNKTCEYISTGDAARKSISSDMIDQYFHTYITSFGMSSLVLGSNIRLNKLKHNIMDVSISPSRIPIELTQVVIPVIEWTQVVSENRRYVYFTMKSTGVATHLYPIETAIIRVLFWSHQFTVDSITKSDDSASLSITTENKPHQTSSGWYDRVCDITLRNILSSHIALCELELVQLSDSVDYQILNTEMVFANGTNYLNTAPEIVTQSFAECTMQELLLQE